MTVARRASAPAALLLTLLIGACTVTTSPPDTRDPDAPGIEQFRAQKAVRYDLTTPPTPQELGVPEGRTGAIFDRDGSEYWDVTFTLPGGATFTTSKAFGVGVLIRDVPGGLLNDVGVNVRAEDPGELGELLRRDVDQLGIDAAEVSDLVSDVQAGARGTKRVLTGRDFGYLSTSVEVRIPDGTGDIALNYHFTWEPGPAPEPSVNPA